MAKGEEWSEYEDSVILELVPKQKVSSASVRIGRTRNEIERRYLALTMGKKLQKSRAATEDGATAYQRRKIRECLARKKAEENIGRGG